MPYVSAPCGSGPFFGVGGGANLLDDPFGGADLVGTHDEEFFVYVEDAVFREDIEDRGASEEGFGEVEEVVNDVVARVGPV